jgi:hypothetical protein
MSFSLEILITPIVVFVCGVIIGFIAWASKKILHNIEEDIKYISSTVLNHSSSIVKLEFKQESQQKEISSLQLEINRIRDSRYKTNNQEY